MNVKEPLMKSMNETLFNHFFYYYLHLKRKRIPGFLNLRNPSTFNEKTIWLKIHQRYPNAHILADKVLVKDFVKERIGEKYVIPTLAVFESASQLEPAALPESFVLKANHGSAWNVICPDKSRLDLEAVKAKLDGWLAKNYYDLGKEYQYRSIMPRIICEKFLDSTPENPLVDYKVFCFGGRPRYIQVDLDRFTNHTRNFYDIDWNLMPFTTLYPLGRRKLPRPQALEEMLDISARLSDGLKFARIDLYFHRGSVFFGEVTFHHGGGFEPFDPPEWDRKLGALIDLG